jgi:muramidase (phage lysozyme)
MMPIFGRRGFSPELSAFDGPVAADEAASLNPRPSLFGGARVAAEAAPTKIGFCRRGFRPELSALDGPVAADEAASPNPGPSVFGGAKGRG